ncbi:GPI mannosyltransferase 1 [Punctularia strigosozonata HHB-11173 SS5]|uniref:GPI mannosyltransferase 1 n=1 Tax=Punctularia strigosozonata (strain HHB-11173) TaxID=741275 RepID=UPI0004417B06|nr:GPI mannosyltransferase 1 [Punctularia strigosozonata HHB-11173 SS5]EIN07237.1 GPI mannosyltransferase 1 [Punctularia strigosozonata HHB-11173 SS5]
MSAVASHLRSLSFRHILLSSALLRVALVLYSEWHDARSALKYTDVDYRVFSDATRFLLNPSAEEGNVAQGPLARQLGLNIGDPYTRETYRYTPLLALLLSPNEWVHQSFGKYLFSLCDILAGLLLFRMLTTVILPDHKPEAIRVKPSSDARIEKPASNPVFHKATLLCASHLLNPMVFTISTRGSSEAILLLLVLSTLYAALLRRWNVAAVLLGLSTHWKIYPVIYGVACLGVISADYGYGRCHFVWTLFNRRTTVFALISATTFFALGGAMYLLWGYPFIYQSYLYHIHRIDHRHNFSPYFYVNYLTYPGIYGDEQVLSPLQRFLASPLLSFLPQMTLALGTGLAFGRQREDLPFAWFVQTAVFVIFNKVCTSQYFLWYLVFLPLLIPRLSMSKWQALLCVGVWAGVQALWLAEAYKLEFLGENVFLGLWVRGLIYVIGNCWVLTRLMAAYAV